jgi:diguanylate cyclase (GGDEF)-like protein
MIGVLTRSTQDISDYFHNTMNAYLAKLLRIGRSRPARSLHPELHPFNLVWSKTVLGCGILTVSGIWIYEASCLRVNQVDQYGYPILLTVFGASLLTLQLRPKTWQILVNTNFLTLAMYFVIYTQAMLYAPSSNYNLYDVATFPQWFPIIYVTAFLFLRRQTAISFSIVIYTSIALPFLLNLLLNRAEFLHRLQFPILLSMLEAHPVYIALLLGVSTLQEAFVRATAYAEAMSIAAQIDHLTQLPNRRSLTETLQTQLSKFQSGVINTGFAVILLDVDRFKLINDTFGHAMGDQVLIAIAGILQARLRQQDKIGRWGGEEFLLVTQDTTAIEAVQTAERLRALICEHVACGETIVSASFGISLVSPDDTLESIVQRADQALYMAKEKGRNRVEVAGLA